MIDDDQGRFTEAENHYLAVLRQSPDNPDLLASLGWSYQLQGKYEDSERVLQEALRRDPHHQTALYNLGWLYGNRGDYDRALAIFREAGSEAQAQQALAELRQTAGGRVPPVEQAYAVGQQNSAPTTSTHQGPLNPGLSAAQIDPSNPKAKKFIDEYHQKLAEQNRQRELQNQSRARNIAAPDPWKNSRSATAVAGQRNGPPARAIPGDPAFQGNAQFDQGGANGRYTENGAAFSGATPTQANQARQAEPAGSTVGERPFAAGATNARSAIAQNLNYEQPAGSATRPQYPIITPGAGGGATNQQSPPPSNGSWNSLPADNASSNPGTSHNVSADYQGLEWMPAGTGSAGPSGQPTISGGVVNAAIPQAGGATGGRNPWQDAQTTAAQLGLSAGPGGLGLPLSDWPNGASPQLQNTTPPNQNPARNASPPANTGSWPQGPGAGNDLRQLQPGPQQNNQATPGGAAAQPTGSGLAPWPGRPLGATVVPGPVVPSAQGAVYGNTEQSALPNFYSGRTAISRQQ